MRRHTPIIKWAGGKTKLMPSSASISHMIRADAGLNRLSVRRRVSEHVCHRGTPGRQQPNLINLYRNIQRNKPAFIREVSSWRKGILKKRITTNWGTRLQYQRGWCPAAKSYSVLRYEWLGYNGLCRYNLKRKFSVPWENDTSSLWIPRKSITSHSGFGRWIESRRFWPDAGVCRWWYQIYCDPPYDKISKTSFVSYMAYHSIRAHMLNWRICWWMLS